MAEQQQPSNEKPFKITIPDEDLELLKTKLESTRFPDEIEDAKRDYGVPLADVQRLVAYWKDQFNWRDHETQLNEDLPQFTRDIEVEGFGTLNIHYVHRKSSVSTAIPLLFMHGWPGSFIEVRKILPLLIADSPEHPSFHVVAPSLPGYGFSEAPKKRGFALDQIAEVGHKLMLALGYDEYVTQGGDWGAFIGGRIASKYGGKNNKAWHSNLPLATAPRFSNRPLVWLQSYFTSLTPWEKAGLERTNWFRNQGQGYAHLQSTQPQTLGYGVTDSPAGVLAWIYEKLVNWSDDYKWTDDDVLTWISIYWFSRAGPAASLRIYYEHMKLSGDFSGPKNAKIPIGYSYFPKEIVIFPRHWYKEPHLVFESQHERGGHFAATECPDLLVGDLRKMFGKGGPAFGVVASRNGYAE
ncbi:hypothetical protein AGABI1DRAFT_69424 [Agaricus bisporus var. burnettii JB137-S8]|uniref:Epoxide hydrolase N-terminal domain-containing protein n=1 Tax=Agaricus bisporus var. burnettii (strain JB137-S8 / ATCC MYA-4627 / FGSC 10392) TaxID=597362 RepID=K5W8K6_AGABU|nr:uncharacterized protein AGABI1DRAFT_69424 [Agaricus bisporus var. burnettii JB137-S8]EKM83184.1 hypothetical protein AGABI1DRAFT_69424 [Agaricus bisporus var. burnettii JB137-S8]